MIEVTNVVKTYPGHQQPVEVLRDVSISATPGDFVSIQGSSGCGKSTLLLTMGGLLHPNSGKVTIDAQDIYGIPNEQRARLRASTIGFVFQQFHLVPYLSVMENILAPALALRLDHQHEHARDLADRLGLVHRLDHVPSELSTGERQRTALARALLNRPKVLLADEPTGNLDEENAAVVLGHLQDFAAEGGVVILVTHDSSAAANAKHHLQMTEGTVTPA